MKYKIALIIASCSIFTMFSYAQTTPIEDESNEFGAVVDTNWVGVAGAGEDQTDSLVGVIKNGVNYTLWLLSLIALIILIYAGFNMVTAGEDSGKYKQGFTTLRQTLIGFAFIALSWFVLSMTFYVIGLVTKQDEGSNNGGGWGDTAPVTAPTVRSQD